MIDYTISLDDDVLDAVLQAVEQSPRAVTTVINRSILPGYEQRVKKLTEYPGPVKYPIRWKSERQRRAYFATNGFGKGIPYRRTGALRDAWRVDARGVSDGLTIFVGNTSPYARYVIGIQQQPFHADTGWPVVDDELLRIEADLQDDVIDAWYSVIDPGAGVVLT